MGSWFYYPVNHGGNEFPKLMQGWGINHVENIMGFKKNVDTFYELLTKGGGHTIHNKKVYWSGL